VIINDLDIVRISFTPLKTDTPLIVNSDTPLTFPITFKLFQSIGWWDSQVVQGNGIVDHTQFPYSDLLNIRRQFT
jgi:hypothetical protein